MSLDLYSIADWSALYENNRSRLVKNMTWVAVPNNHDGDRYSELIARKDSAVIFAAWILILQVASKCEPRGTLQKASGEPHDFDSLARRTRAPREWFSKAIPYLVQIGWLSHKSVAQTDLALTCAETAPPAQEERTNDVNDPSTKEGKEGRERKKEEMVRAPLRAPASASDEQFLAELRAGPAYRGIDVDAEFARMTIWCRERQKQPSRRRFLAWLNRVDRPIAANARASPAAAITEPEPWREAVKRDLVDASPWGILVRENVQWSEIADATKREIVAWMRAKRSRERERAERISA